MHALLPKFLTRDLAESVVHDVVFRIQKRKPPFHVLKRDEVHIVVLVPAMVIGEEYPNYTLEPQVLYELSSNSQAWKRDYKDIARCKAIQLWHGRSDGGCSIQPHLLYSADAPYYGGVRREGIVVACSGVEPYFDRMISGIIADTLIAFARHGWEKSEDKLREVANLT